MIINDAGRKIVMDNEGCRLVAYKCPAGIWTIGYGHTGDVKQGDKITQHQAETILEYDLERFEVAVGKLCPNANGNQFSALVSFSFNVGIEALKKSTLLRKFLAGAPLSAADEFGKWVNGGGKRLPGLVKRRAAEKALFLTGVS
jgi:lysozyme